MTDVDIDLVTAPAKDAAPSSHKLAFSQGLSIMFNSECVVQQPSKLNVYK